MNRDLLLNQLMDSLSEFKRGLQLHHEQNSTIPVGQKAALFIIASMPTCNVKELAQKLSVTSGAATQHVEALVQAGYVERVTDTDDRRTVNLKTTRQGRAELKKLRQHYMDMIRELFADISDTELKAYVDILQKVTSKLKP